MIEVVYDKMFSPEELESLSPGEIEDIVNEKLYNDDFEWNKTKGYTYDTKGQIAKNLHTLLYKCPKCGKEFKMIGAGDEIRCLNCENGAKVEDNYAIRPFNKECVIPETIGKWARWQRQEIKKEIQDPNYSFSCSVKLGMLPEDHFLAPEDTSEIVGEGKLTIDRSGLTYQGSKNGKPYTFHIDSLQLPTYGMCTDMSKFYTFVNGVFVEFYPSIPCVEKFFEVTEEIHRLNGGKWQDFKFLQDK